MKINEQLRSEWLRLVLLAVPFLVLVPLWDKFPERIAIHWGLDGQPNGWAEKTWGLLLLPVVNVALAALMACLLPLDARVRNYGPETRANMQRVMSSVNLAIAAFMTFDALLVDAVALGWKVDMLRVVTLGMLVLLAVLGNLMPKLKPNRFVGIRTPWTLKSPEVWARTHRLFGAIMLGGSLALLLPCALFPPAWGVWLVVGFALALSLGAMIYSYRIRGMAAAA